MKLNSNQRYKFILLVILFCVIFVTILFGFNRIDRFWVYAPSITSFSSWEELGNKLLSHKHLFSWAIVITVLFFGIGFLVDRRKKIARIEYVNYKGILHSFVDILSQNWYELPLLFIITLFVVFNITTFMVDLSEASPSDFAPTFVALMISIFSIFITILGVYYAFLAENKSNQLLTEHALFLPHFDMFMKRIINKLKQINDEINSGYIGKSEKYTIKCMLLTPFLGHGGITPNTINVANLFHDYDEQITNLLRNRAKEIVELRILTLAPEQLKKWYTEIQWVRVFEEQSKKQKINLDSSKFKKQTIRDKFFSEIDRGAKVNQKNRFIRDETIDGFDLKSFIVLREKYRNFIYQQTLVISQIENIPFQMFLVKKGNLHEFALLTYVGSDTYMKLKNDIININEDHSTLSIDGILKELHACFYTQDHRHCKLLETHFDHFWSKENENIFTTNDKWDNILHFQNDKI